MNIPDIGDRFKVSFTKFKDTAMGKIVCVDGDPHNSDRAYRIKLTYRIQYDMYGNPYSLPDTFVEVEKNWFDTELCGRIITPVM